MLSKFKKIVKPRVFNILDVDKKNNTITKKSINTEKLINEISWFINNKKQINKYIPKIIDYSIKKIDPYVKFEFINYPTLHYLFVNKQKTNWKKIFNEIDNMLKTFSKINVCEYDKNSIFQMYIEKTVDRLNELTNHKKFNIFFKNNIYINDKKYPNLIKIIDDIRNIKFDVFYNKCFCLIHGDLCFSNMFFTDKSIKIIDCRGKFGTCYNSGDQNYEWAKLFHSVYGLYDFIIEKKHTIGINNKNRIEVEFNISEKYIKNIQNEFDIIVQKNKLNTDVILLIESLLFFSMISLHSESYSNQLVMLAQAITLFYDKKHLFDN